MILVFPKSWSRKIVNRIWQEGLLISRGCLMIVRILRTLCRIRSNSSSCFSFSIINNNSSYSSSSYSNHNNSSNYPSSSNLIMRIIFRTKNWILRPAQLIFTTLLFLSRVCRVVIIIMGWVKTIIIITRTVVLRALRCTYMGRLNRVLRIWTRKSCMDLI